MVVTKKYEMVKSFIQQFDYQFYSFISVKFLFINCNICAKFRGFSKSFAGHQEN